MASGLHRYWKGIAVVVVGGLAVVGIAVAVLGPREEGVSLADWQRGLEELGWSSQGEEQSGDLRFLRYKNDSGQVSLRCELAIVGSGAVEAARFSVSGPAGDLEARSMGIAACRRVAHRVMPSAESAFPRAVAAARPTDERWRDGVASLEGSARTGGGWAVKALLYEGAPSVGKRSVLAKLSLAREGAE